VKLYTAGHSTMAIHEFIEMLQRAGIALVADVRSKPRSRLAHFDQVPLEESLDRTGMRYRFLGDKLGGMPRDPQIAERWRQGKLDEIIVAHLRLTDEWSEGLAELVSLVRSTDGGVCIMCSEGDPNECHRKAVALDAAEAQPDLVIEHLTAKGSPTEVGVQGVFI
jgi:uncharacterized protein (DUF488 family)